MKTCLRSTLVLALLLPSLADGQVTQEYEGKVVLFGNLHAHSKLSDDVENAGDEMLPIRAFNYADTNGLDFLAITDHHKAVDANHRLFLEPSEYESQLYQAAMDYNASHAGEFIAIPGIEWGATATGNHVNLLGISELPPDNILDAQYDKLYDWATSNARFVQLNHPSSWRGQSGRNDKVGNFGTNLYESPEAFQAALDPIAKTISIISSVYGGHISGEFRHSTEKTHREVHKQNFREWLSFLNMGFHLSPAANQDTHWRNWGTVTAARTAVWADRFDYDALMDALRRNRVYATEDDELAVAFRVGHNGKWYWMGETVALPGEEADVDVVVKAWQVTTDELNDPTNEGPYTVSVWSDYDGVGGMQAEEWTQKTTDASGEVTIPLQVVAGEYVLVQVTEKKGKDNLLGDEETPETTSGATPANGNRKNKNDSAWTSPVWFVSSAAD